MVYHGLSPELKKIAAQYAWSVTPLSTGVQDRHSIFIQFSGILSTLMTLHHGTPVLIWLSKTASFAISLSSTLFSMH